MPRGLSHNQTRVAFFAGLVFVLVLAACSSSSDAASPPGSLVVYSGRSETLAPIYRSSKCNLLLARPGSLSGIYRANFRQVDC